ncbi:RNA-dependent RNA polymerase [Datura stramonium]|uniref:RNA-dependent RNA polymerase n=1 Tax=Datura stramonium TaxID=4076 RepID=A0ABS8SS14_DATST|nr:RNA-dependent RNA polymerase [Datura stramonium]
MPHSNEASGSDLDSDFYFVTWDENLIPPSKKSWMPMDYAPAEVKQLSRQVNHMKKYKVNGEEEVVTGHIWSMPKYRANKQGELKERPKHAYNTLRKQFRNVFKHLELDFDMLPDDEKNDMYEERHLDGIGSPTIIIGWMTRSLELQI